MTARVQSDVALVHDPATYTSGVPYDVLARLRDTSPVVRVDEPPMLGWPGGTGYWLVLRHPDVEAVLKQPATFSSWLGATQIRDPATPEHLAYVRRMMLNMDPPEHSRLRRLLARSFTPRAVARLEDRIRGHARMILDRALGDADGGELDLGKDVAADLPLLTLADVLGVPQRGRRDVDPAGAGGRRRRAGVRRGVREPVLAVRRRRERDAAQRHPRRADRAAGPPSRPDTLRARPGLLASAVEEMLRWWTPVMTFRRTASRAVRLSGVDIGPGDKVVVSFASANRDPSVFRDPDRFDLERSPNPHLAFGHGPHFCLGSHLARVQMRALVGDLLARTSSLEYAGTPAFLQSNFQRGVKRLPARWTRS